VSREPCRFAQDASRQIPTSGGFLATTGSAPMVGVRDWMVSMLGYALILAMARRSCTC